MEMSGLNLSLYTPLAVALLIVTVVVIRLRKRKTGDNKRASDKREITASKSDGSRKTDEPAPPRVSPGPSASRKYGQMKRWASARAKVAFDRGDTRIWVSALGFQEQTSEVVRTMTEFRRAVQRYETEGWLDRTTSIAVDCCVCRKNEVPR